MLDILLSEVLDPKGKKNISSGKISFGVMKFFLEAGGVHTVDFAALVKPQASSAAVSESSSAGVSSDVIANSKKAARKILIACHNTITELVGKLDKTDEGIVNREDLKKAIETQKVADLDRDELNSLMKGCDKGQIGYVASSKFIENLYNFAAESESEALMRRLGKTLSHSDTNLQQEMSRFATSGTGKIDKNTFKKCFKQLSIALSDSEIAKLLAAATEISGSEDIDIKKFCNNVNEVAKAKPLPSFITSGAKGSSAGKAGGAMGAFEAEKKYKKNLEALKSEIEEKNREMIGLRKEVKDCHDRYNRLDQDKKNLEGRLVDVYAKPPKQTAADANAHSQAQQLSQVRD